MKRCPECRRDYYDDSLLYCLDDGSALLEGPAGGDEPATAILRTSDAAGDAPTRAQIHTTGQTPFPPEATSKVTSDLRGFDRRLLAIPVLLVLVVIGGVFAFRSLVSSNNGQVNSIAVLP